MPDPKTNTAPSSSSETPGPSSTLIPSPFGLTLPWSEPAWYNALDSPYYTPSHRALRAYVRKYIDAHILPHQLDWEAQGGAPRAAALHYARSGLPFLDVPGPYRPPGFSTVAGIPVEQLDAFHTLLLTDETARVEGGIMASLAGASVIGAPPVVNHGTAAQKRAWLPGLFDWTTSFCLGITEASGGSDVGAIRTRAVKSADGASYAVSGTKKWITGAPWATHMTTAVRTGGEGMGGVSLLVVPLRARAGDGVDASDTFPGVEIRRIANSGQAGGGASWVRLDNVKVPAENLLGRENAGFKYIMTNFNRERYIMAVSCNRKARTCLSTALQYAHDRETFGTPLISNQIIRHKIISLAHKVEAHWAWLEQIAFHIDRRGWQSDDVASRIALAKVQGGRILEEAAREAQQIMGGVAYQRGGPGGGGVVEQINRDLRMMVVGGGSEEILGELAFREETKRSAKL